MTLSYIRIDARKGVAALFKGVFAIYFAFYVLSALQSAGNQINVILQLIEYSKLSTPDCPISASVSNYLTVAKQLSSGSNDDGKKEYRIIVKKIRSISVNTAVILALSRLKYLFVLPQKVFSFHTTSFVFSGLSPPYLNI